MFFHCEVFCSWECSGTWSLLLSISLSIPLTRLSLILSVVCIISGIICRGGAIDLTVTFKLPWQIRNVFAITHRVDYHRFDLHWQTVPAAGEEKARNEARFVLSIPSFHWQFFLRLGMCLVSTKPRIPTTQGNIPIVHTRAEWPGWPSASMS